MVRATFQVGRKFERIQKRLADLTPVMKQVGMLMVEESMMAFERQSWGNKQWQPRAVPNAYGLISDFAKGSTPPKRRMQPRPALRDTGRLMQSITYKVRGKQVSVGTSLRYARVLHEGGQIESRKITRIVQRRAAKWLKRQPKKVQKELGWLTAPHNLNTYLQGEVEARPFLGMTPKLAAHVRKTMIKHIREV